MKGSHYARSWWIAIRPHTLSASIGPVCVGIAAAAANPPGKVDWPWVPWVLLGAALAQVATNLTDEYADHNVGAAVEKFPAPHKVIRRGLLSERAVRIGAAVCFGAAVLIASLLVLRTGWPMLVLCAGALLVAWGYSAGPFPLGDFALGEVLVFVFMGPGIVGGTAYALTQEIDGAALWYGLPVGALAASILLLNNLRDAPEDAAQGRRTLVCLWGAHRAVRLLFLSIGFAYASAVLGGVWSRAAAAQTIAEGVSLYGSTLAVLLPMLSVPLAWGLLHAIRVAQEPQDWHAALRRASALHGLFCLLLSLGIVWQA